MLKATGSSVKTSDQSNMVTRPKTAGITDTTFHISSVANSAGSVGRSKPTRKHMRKPTLMKMFVSIPYEDIIETGKVSQMDLPIIRHAQLPPKPRIRRPRQIIGKFLNMVRIEPKMDIA